jgi:hypothetical protein
VSCQTPSSRTGWFALLCLTSANRCYLSRKRRTSGRRTSVGRLKGKGRRDPEGHRRRHRRMGPKISHREQNHPLRRFWFLILLHRPPTVRNRMPGHRTICKWIEWRFRPRTRHQSKRILHCRTRHLPRSNLARDRLRFPKYLSLPLGILSVSSATKRKKRYRVSIWTRIQIRERNNTGTLAFC